MSSLLYHQMSSTIHLDHIIPNNLVFTIFSKTPLSLCYIIKNPDNALHIIIFKILNMRYCLTHNYFLREIRHKSPDIPPVKAVYPGVFYLNLGKCFLNSVTSMVSLMSL